MKKLQIFKIQYQHRYHSFQVFVFISLELLIMRLALLKLTEGILQYNDYYQISLSDANSINHITSEKY